MFDAVNQHALDRVHILDHARHQIAGGAIVEPAEGQELNVRIKIAAQIENHFLLERIVQDNPQRVEGVLKQKCHRRQQNQRQQFLGMICAYDIVDDPFGYGWKNDHHQCPEDRTRQRTRR